LKKDLGEILGIFPFDQPFSNRKTFFDRDAFDRQSNKEKFKSPLDKGRKSSQFPHIITMETLFFLLSLFCELFFEFCPFIVFSSMNIRTVGLILLL